MGERLHAGLIDECRHADDRIGIEFADEPQVAFGAHDFAAAAADHEHAKFAAGVMRLPEGEVRGVGEQLSMLMSVVALAEAHEPVAHQPASFGCRGR